MIYTALPDGAGRLWAGCWLWSLCASLAQGDAAPVAVHAAGVDVTRPSLRLAGAKVALNTLFEPITPGRVSLDQC